jgi:hypothetical protein
MRTRLFTLSIVAVAMAMLGCNGLLDALGPSTTTVTLVNSGSGTLTVQIFTGTNQNASDFELEGFGDEQNITVPANSTRTFSLPCDDLQALLVADADVDIFAGIGPSADLDVLRDGTDFNCGDTVTLTFTYTLLPPNLTITPSTD